MRGLVVASLEEQYAAQQPDAVRALAKGVLAATPFPTAIVSPPSSRNDAAGYRQAILGRIKLRDLSGGFSRKNLVFAATASSPEAMIEEFVYEPVGGESESSHW